MKALLVDFGGVLTTNVFDSFRQFCRAEGLDEGALVEVLRSSEETRAQLRRLETGAIDADAFAAHLGPLLGVADTAGMIDRVFAGMRREPRMTGAIEAARAQGIATGLISNSVGTDVYDRQWLDATFDAVVISGEVGLHKPEPEIYRLAAERLDLAPRACVFVDDLRENCAGAEAVGMTAILHRGPDGTLPQLERLLGLELPNG